MAIETSILLAFAAMICWGIGDFLIQKSTRKIGDIETLCVIGIVGALILLPFIWSDIGAIFSWTSLGLLLLLGVITFVAAIFNFEALKQGKLSIIDVVLELELPVTIALGYFILSERLSWFQLLVIGSIFIGMILMATESFSHFKAKLEKGVWIALIAALFMGGVNFLTAVSAKEISPLMAIWIPWVIFTIFTLIVIWRREGLTTFALNFKENRRLLIVMGIFDTVAWLFYAHAVYSEEISIITAITESYPAIAMFLGLTFNKESIKWFQLAGALVALGASFVLSYTL